MIDTYLKSIIHHRKEQEEISYETVHPEEGDDRGYRISRYPLSSTVYIDSLSLFSLFSQLISDRAIGEYMVAGILFSLTIEKNLWQALEYLIWFSKCFRDSSHHFILEMILVTALVSTSLSSTSSQNNCLEVFVSAGSVSLVRIQGSHTA